ncbi:MAG: exo-alpha-sialidase [Chloroflexi bacterium]|nr:exo-alpha-sialidase [Chloroflexota bacterium]
MRRAGLVGVAVVLVALMSALFPTSALAGEGDMELGGIFPGRLAFPQEPVSRMLSGRAWLVASGLDPAVRLGQGDLREAPPSSGEGSSLAQLGGGGAALVPYRDPSAKFSRNILVPEDFSQFPYQTEPSLAMDPKDPDHLLLSFIDYGFSSMVSYSSIDGGATWSGPHIAKYPRQDLGIAGDPIVGFDRQGKAYYAFISLNVEEFSIGPLLGQALVSSIAVSQSSDAEITWRDPVKASWSTLTSRVLPSPDDRPRGTITIGFLDKPWMTIGPDPKDPGKDVMYVTYTKFIETLEILWVDELPFLGYPRLETVIELVSSKDGGVTWTKAVEVSPRARYTILFNREEGEESGPRADSLDEPKTQEGSTPLTGPRQVVQGSDVVVAPDGKVFVAWMDTTEDDTFEGLAEIYIRRSDDAGATFSRARRVSGFLEPPFQPRNGAFRYWATAFPKLATGQKGEVYVLYSAPSKGNPDDDGDVFAVVSTDQGETWSGRIRVNDDETSRLQFFPEIAVDPKGVLHAIWADMRDDRPEVRYHIYYASSEDGGRTWSRNARVTDFPTNPNRAFPRGQFIGDYFALVAGPEDVYIAWADGRLGEFGAANQKIAFARKRLMPTPQVFISPPSGPGGKDVVIQGFNFEAEQQVFIEVAGVIVSTARTQNEGRFSAQIFVPISGQGAHRVRVIDASGNVAASSFFMDFGFDTIQKATTRLDELSKRLEATAPVAGSPSPGSEPPLSAEVQQLRTTVDELTRALESRRGISPWLLVAVVGAAIPLLIMAGLLVVLARRPRPARASDADR